MSEDKRPIDRMSELGLPSIEGVKPVEKPDLYDHHIFAEAGKTEVKEKWKAGEYSDDEVRRYVAGTNLKNKQSFWGLKKDDVKTLYKGGFLPEGMVEEYIALKNHSTLPSSWAGDYLLTQMSQGRTREDVEKDLGGIQFTLADPSQLVVDALTGGTTIGLRAASRKGVQTAVKSGAGKKVIRWTKDLLKGALTKEAGKEAAIQTGFGVVATGGMMGAEEAGGGTGTQLLAGLVTPLGASVLMNMTRQSFIQWFRRTQKGNPSLASELRNIILQSDDNGMKGMREIMDELDEAAVGYTKFSSYDEAIAIPIEKIRPSAASQESPQVVHLRAKLKAAQKGGHKKAETVYQGELDRLKEAELKVDTGKPEIEEPPMTRQQAEQLLTDVKAGKSDGEVLKQLGKGKGAELAGHIHKIHNVKIEQARGGVKPRAGEIKKARKFIKDNYTSFADNTGKRVLDVENALGDVNHLHGNMKNVSEKLAAFQEVYKTMLAELEPMAKRVDLTFTEEVALANKIQEMAAFTEAIYGIRAEFGRGLGMFNRAFHKLPMDLNMLPRGEYDIIETATRKQVQKFLKRYRTADGLKDKLNVARTVNKNRFMKGFLEAQQGALLMSHRTQAVNIFGNTQAWGIETMGRYAGVSYEAWKMAGGMKSPISFNKGRMAEIYHDIIAHRTAWNMLFKDGRKVLGHVRVSKGTKGVKQNVSEAVEAIEPVTRFDDFAHKVQKDEDIGTFWKALVTGEAQIDPFYKVDGQEGQAIENMMKIRWRGKTLFTANPTFSQTVGGFFRLSFKGLTAMDEAFKTLAVQQKMSSELFRQGRAEGAEDIGQYIKTGIANMELDDPIRLRSTEFGREATYTQPLGDSAAAFERFLNTGRVGLSIKLTTLPFFKILINLTKYSLKNSPLGLGSKRIRDTLFHGSSTQKAETMAKMAVGTAAMIGGWQLYEHGRLTGRTPRTQFQGWNNAHAQDYSWVSRDAAGEITGYTDISLLDPASTWIMVSADLALAGHMMADAYVDDKTQDEFDEAMKDAMVAFGWAFVEPFVNRTFAKGVNETLTFITNPDRTDFGKFSMRQMNKYYPRLIDMVNDASGNNEIRREAHDIVDGFWKRFDPAGLEPMRHAVYGTIEKNDPRFFGVLNYKKAVDPIQTKMMELGMNIKPLEDAMSLVGESKKLTPKQYSDLGKELEKLPIKQRLQEIMDSEAFKITDATTQASMLQEVIDAYREIAKANYQNTAEGREIRKELIEQLKVTEQSIRGINKIPSKYGQFYSFLNKENE